MTAQDSLDGIHLSDDFHVELVASESDVMSPVEMAFDENGKIYVAEMMDYPEDPPPGRPARSRIRLLEDTNGDGKIDRVTTFADHLLAVSGFMPWKGGLIVTRAPRHSVSERHERGRRRRLAHRPLYRLFQGQPGGSHHKPAACRRQLDRLLQQRLRWPHHFPAASRDTATIGSRLRLPFRPDQREGRGDLRCSSVSATRSTSLGILSSHRTPCISATSLCR